MILRFHAAYAWRSLQRGGQRSALAIACLAFGVLSVVALQQVSVMIRDVMLVSPRFVEGGDLALTKNNGTISEEDLRSLASLGLAHTTPIAIGRAMWLKSAVSGRAMLVSEVLGVDPATFPLYGDIELRKPAPGNAHDVLTTRGAAIVTRDLAERFALRVGDTFALFGSPQAPPFELRVGAIAAATPSRRGLSVLVGLDTARQHGIGGIARAMARHATPDSLVPALAAAGWSVRLVSEHADTDEAQIFAFMLPAAGILGLLLGGIGVANTMQVLLARRRPEIAALKTLGYTQRHLAFLFGIETAILGLIGGAVGTAAGAGLAWLLMSLLRSGMPYLLDFRIRPGILVAGMLVGVLTALIFGLETIVRAGGVRPLVLLRETEEQHGDRRIVTFALRALLFILFGSLSSIVIGSMPKGFGVVGAGVVGLVLLGLLLTGVLLVVVRVPVHALPLLSMARRHLRHEPRRAAYGLVALFAGVLAIGSAAVSLGALRQQAHGRRIDLAGVNQRVYASRADQAALQRAIRETGTTTFYTDVVTTARLHAAPDSLLDAAIRVFGRSEGEMRWNLSLRDTTDVPADQAAYAVESVATRHALSLGDTLRLHGERGDATLRIAGIYARGGSLLDLGAAPQGIVVPVSVAERLASDNTPIQVSIVAEPGRVGEIAESIGRALPQSVVIGKDALRDAINRLFSGIFAFVVAVAGLALVAGAVLIANAVGLSMLERRRELGVLKAIGYSSGQVLHTVLLENACIGLIGGAMGVAGVHLIVALVNVRFPAAQLSLGLGMSVTLVLVSIAFATISAWVVAWQPTRVRPLEVLRAG